MTALKHLTAPAVAFAAAVLLTACASKSTPAGSAPMAPTAPSQSPSPTTSSATIPTQDLWPSGDPPGQNALDDAVQKVKTAVSGKYAKWYSGIALQQPVGPKDQTPYAVLVYRVPNPALDAAAQAASPTTKMIFIDTKYSAVQCDAVQAKVSKDVGYWKSRGLSLNGWGCQNGLVDIGITDPAAWKSALDARYGADVIEVEKTDPVQAD